MLPAKTAKVFENTFWPVKRDSHVTSEIWLMESNWVLNMAGHLTEGRLSGQNCMNM